MKIIKPGDLSRVDIDYYRAECPECGCIFRFSNLEMDRHSEGWYTSVSVKCPCCHEKINCHSRAVVPEKAVKSE